jgi:hypothetical protein
MIAVVALGLVIWITLSIPAALILAALIQTREAQVAATAEWSGPNLRWR